MRNQGRKRRPDMLFGRSNWAGEAEFLQRDRFFGGCADQAIRKSRARSCRVVAPSVGF